MDIIRQELLWIPFSRQARIEGELNGSSVRIWTLFLNMDSEEKPGLPIKPVHNVNAFLEDYVHDWVYRNGILRYFSRAVHSNVWILIEHKAPRKVRK